MLGMFLLYLVVLQEKLYRTPDYSIRVQPTWSVKAHVSSKTLELLSSERRISILIGILPSSTKQSQASLKQLLVMSIRKSQDYRFESLSISCPFKFQVPGSTEQWKLLRNGDVAFLRTLFMNDVPGKTSFILITRRPPFSKTQVTIVNKMLAGIKLHPVRQDVVLTGMMPANLGAL